MDFLEKLSPGDTVDSIQAVQNIPIKRLIDLVFFGADGSGFGVLCSVIHGVRAVWMRFHPVRRAGHKRNPEIGRRILENPLFNRGFSYLALTLDEC